jgi:hypothetical protein
MRKSRQGSTGNGIASRIRKGENAPINNSFPLRSIERKF